MDILTSDFHSRSVIRDKEGHYVVSSIQQEDIAIVNIRIPSFGASKYLNKILTDLRKKWTVIKKIVGKFNMPLPMLHK